MDIQLTFMNQSNIDSSNIVIYQQNMASRAGNFAVAWQVIANSTPGSSYPFVFSPNLTVNAADSFGNFTPTLPASNGQLFQLSAATNNGNELAYSGPAVNKASIQVRNNLQIGNISANLYRNGTLLATKSGIAPGQKAVFQFSPTIWIGVMSQQVNQGDMINAAILQNVNTQLALAGITRANIIMTGGGVGSNAQPIKFALADIMQHEHPRE